MKTNIQVWFCLLEENRTLLCVSVKQFKLPLIKLLREATYLQLKLCNKTKHRYFSREFSFCRLRNSYYFRLLNMVVGNLAYYRINFLDIRENRQLVRWCNCYIMVSMFYFKANAQTEPKTVGAFQKLPMVMPSVDILYSAIRKAKRLSPTRGIFVVWYISLISLINNPEI